ncbi:hypothetical protein EYR40_008893 [Pleurotus pulmonarius]|nr:hypothetical protein EYR36_009715 [Pleurotus pulmonarius]KAF4594094.1 hypothetical protein EYR40_008893 [Pleurotus pulmonarius]
MHTRPDRTLVVKCFLEQSRNKRITFPSARTCTYQALRDKACTFNQGFSLYSKRYSIQYTDDDGEISIINSEASLTEAILYFSTGGDESSSSSIFGGPRKISIRVEINMEYDGLSLSDTSSIRSFEGMASRNLSQASFNYSAHRPEVDDDCLTVSSRDPGARSPSRLSTPSLSPPEDSASSSNLSPPPVTVVSQSRLSATAGRLRKIASSLSGRSRDRSVSGLEESAAARFPENPSAVFERLRYDEQNASDTSSIDHAFGRDARGAAWLRDQNERVIINVLGGLPAPSESDASSVSYQDDTQSARFSGDLSLQSDDRGKRYYTYTPARSSASQSQYGENGATYESEAGILDSMSVPGPARPTSMQLDWLAAHQVHPPAPSLRSISHNSDPLPCREHIHENGISQGLGQYIPPARSPPPEQITDCSACGIRLHTFRYVCSTCGPKAPIGESLTIKGKGKESPSGSPGLTYPPWSPELSISPSNSSRTLIGDLDLFGNPFRHKPLPSIPPVSGSPGSSSGSSQSAHGPGYELCSNCLETDGVTHAKEGPLIPSLPPSPQDMQGHSSTSRHKAPLRHAFQEKVWGHTGWDDVEHDESKTSNCTFCNATNLRKSYKCASCKQLNVCRGCYSQIHELHPSHAFLVVPERRLRSSSDPDHIPAAPPDMGEEETMKHPGIKCSHCLQDIVGARFHCLLCQAVDICSNCESAGLPGNFDPTESGHTSAHVMIKIPYPLDSSELHTASQRAINLWQRRDGGNLNHSTSETDLSSAVSSYAKTVIGSGASPNPQRTSLDDHGTICRGCNKPIIGIRYQCATCPSKPAPYSLCSYCEERSWHIHNPLHVFFKLHRPVDVPLESANPFLPLLYSQQVAAGYQDLYNPRGYLRSLRHGTALCDCCMNHIQGEWYRCAYCGRDLCEDCESIDAHDETHIFMMFKGPVDMNRFKQAFQNYEDPNGSVPIISYAVYTKPA